jgi:hypothetical protein
MPLVSIIINVCNGAATLRDAIDSVMAQSFDDWELIVWDDRSTDASANIVVSYRDERIRYFLSPEDTTLGAARANAMRQVRGEWIAFLDQDDLWLPHKLEQQMALAADNVGLIYGRTIRFYPSGMERDYDQWHEYEPLPEGDIFTQLFTKSCFPAMSSAVFRRSAVEAIGGIPQEINIIPDYYLYAAVAQRYQVRAVQQPICRYRMHSGSMTQTSAIQIHQEALWLVDHWGSSLDPKVVKLCRKRHHTQIALAEMRRPASAPRGVRRLLTQGSVPSQLLRPFMFVFHLVRRNVRRPYWRVDAKPSQV